MNNIVSTTEIIKTAEYFSTHEKFFSNFPKAWSELKNTVYKLETKQVYDETGNISYDTLLKDGLSASIDLIPEVRECDLPLYKELNLKNISFLRCRPVELPLTLYLKWEFECYVINWNYGESIFCLDYTDNYDLFNLYAHHDFMIFDESVAFVHNYDENGLIKGGWKIETKELINSLKLLFNHINAKSQPFDKYLRLINYSTKLKFRK